MKKKQLTDWYCEQPFDIVTKITGVDLWDLIDDEELLEEGIDNARAIWDKMTLEEMKIHFDNHS